MNKSSRLTRLIIQGEWHFMADGVPFTRRNLTLPARFNLLLQLISKKYRLPISLGIPYTLAVEPASVCNLGCSTCPAGLKRKMCSPALLRQEDFQQTIDLIGDYLTHIQLWSWGEPCLNPALADMIVYAKKKGIIIVTSTNGHFLEDDGAVARLVRSGLDEMILAVDGTTQEVYERYRQGGDLDRVLAGIKNLVRIRDREGSATPRLHMRMVINPFNEHQKDEFAILARSLGVDVVSYKKIDTGMGGVAGDKHLLPHNQDFVLDLSDIGYPFKCSNFWNFPVLSSSGNIGLCSLDSQRETKMAHIAAIKNFRKFWNSAQARANRVAIKNDANTFEFCQECVTRDPAFNNASFDVTWFKGGQL